MSCNVLVTGGTGLLGNAIKNLSLKKDNLSFKWYFLSSTDCDLRDKKKTYEVFNNIKPTYVIHCAACVGGLFKNMNNNLTMFQNNLDINRNVLEVSYKIGVKKLVSVLTTCIFPDSIANYPFTESELHLGPPHFSNEGYAYAKRMLEVESRLYRKTYDVNFVCAIPTNIYGPFDNFNLTDAHVVPALIHQAYLSNEKKNNLVVLGTGKPLRQFIYSYDVADILIWMMKNYNDEEPLIICNEEEISIHELANSIINNFDNEIIIRFDDSKADGQYKKTASNIKLKKYLPNYNFTYVDEGLKKTIEWFKESYPNVRK